MKRKGGAPCPDDDAGVSIPFKKRANR